MANSLLVENHNRRFPISRFSGFTNGLSDLKWLEPGSLTFTQYLLLAIMLGPTAMLPLLSTLSQLVKLADNNHFLSSIKINTDRSVGLIEGFSHLPVFEGISSNIVNFYSQQVDRHIPSSHPKVNMVIARAVGLRQQDIKGKGRSEWTGIYLQALEDKGINLKGITKLTATGLFSLGIVIDKGGQLVKYGWDSLNKRSVRIEIKSMSQLTRIVFDTLKNVLSGNPGSSSWDNINDRSLIDNSPEAQATAQTVAKDQLPNTDDYKVIALSGVASIPLQPEQVILTEEAIKAGAKLILDNLGYVTAIAIPNGLLIGGLSANPGVVKDVIEGPPRIMINNQWYQLTEQQTALLRLGQPIEVNGQIINPKGEVVARIKQSAAQPYISEQALEGYDERGLIDGNFNYHPPDNWSPPPKDYCGESMKEYFAFLLSHRVMGSLATPEHTVFEKINAAEDFDQFKEKYGIIEKRLKDKGCFKYKQGGSVFMDFKIMQQLNQAKDVKNLIRIHSINAQMSTQEVFDICLKIIEGWAW